MEVILRARQTGKTAELIKRAGNCNGYIVCHDRNSVQQVANLARQMKIDINFPLTLEEFLNRQYHGVGVKKFHIDNVEFLLRLLSEVPIETITLTDESHIPVPNINFNWIDDEVASINCPDCGKELMVSIYGDRAVECCSKKYILQQRNWVEEVKEAQK